MLEYPQINFKYFTHRLASAPKITVNENQILKENNLNITDDDGGDDRKRTPSTKRINVGERWVPK